MLIHLYSLVVSRKCRLNKKGINNAAIDILFIDMQRKWEHVNPERTTGKRQGGGRGGGLETVKK